MTEATTHSILSSMPGDWAKDEHVVIVLFWDFLSSSCHRRWCSYGTLSLELLGKFYHHKERAYTSAERMQPSKDDFS
jgi:hypothetical protein